MNVRELAEALNRALNSADIPGVALNAVVMSGDGAPEWIELVPAGTVVGRDGRKWVNDQPDAVVAAFNQSSMDIPLDMEHATELQAPKGNPAPAVGWIKELQNRSGAIFGRVEWTEAGRNAVEAKSYRYVSPVIVFEKSTGRVVAVTSVGLTNRPNLYLQALNGREDEMDLKLLLTALGLAAGVSFEEALAHIGQLRSDLSVALNSQPSLDKYVPRADYDQALNRATSAEQRLADNAKDALNKDIDAAISKALAEGKITPATEAYHRAQCAQDGGLARFAEFVKAAPSIGDPSTLDQRIPGDQATALNAEDRQVCEALGLSIDDFKKHNNL